MASSAISSSSSSCSLYSNVSIATNNGDKIPLLSFVIFSSFFFFSFFSFFFFFSFFSLGALAVASTVCLLSSCLCVLSVTTTGLASSFGLNSATTCFLGSGSFAST
jgi:hypothetical protein